MVHYRFRLSEMMPNSWFYKLKDMGNRNSRGNRVSIGSRAAQNCMRRSQAPRSAQKESTELKSLSQLPQSPPQKPCYLTKRPSYYVPSIGRAEKNPHSPTHPKASDTLFPLNTPRKPKKKSLKKPLNPVFSVSSCRKQSSSFPNSESEPFSTASDMTIYFGMDQKPDLHPIVTKPKFTDKNVKLNQGSLLNQSKARKPPPGLHRLKMSVHCPGKDKKRAPSLNKKGLKETFVVVKSSTDPQKDFTESMVEMIVENNILASKDLEELLACYLSLNSNEFHDMIVKAFQQIWFALTDIIL